jgi:hypothetical protein
VLGRTEEKEGVGTHTCTQNLPIFHNMHQTMTTHDKYTVYTQIRCRSLKKKTIFKIGKKLYSGFLQGGHMHTYTLHNRHIFSSR